ncbi:pituitary tumor-transforming gene 1 protein-interacting protein-like isoform X2 [Lineus longissimus]|uniref:pituitary tumor-transforming gene 1 protein-interacting protein-like isoform X2 n=1 Tax=Lineus longissimus TaxID=88925 RepID=UPI002B4F6311
MKTYEVITTLAVFVFLMCLSHGQSQSSSTTTTTTAKPVPATTTLTPEEECTKVNYSCDTCVAKAECMWCETGPLKCKPYPVGHIIPRAEDCDLGEARWGVCWLNFKVLIITMSVIAGILLISTCCCIYCCCCRGKGNKKKYAKEEERWEREREERKQRADERKEERKERADEIRKKYGIGFKGSAGLIKDDNPYQRFDA